MPTMDKLAVPANMLNTSQDWLRWGDLSLDKPDDSSYGRRLGTSDQQPRDALMSFCQGHGCKQIQQRHTHVEWPKLLKKNKPAA